MPQVIKMQGMTHTRTIRFLLVAVTFTLLGGCSNPVEDLKSPCVGTDDSPCVHRPVNTGLSS